MQPISPDAIAEVGPNAAKIIDLVIFHGCLLALNPLIRHQRADLREHIEVAVSTFSNLLRAEHHDHVFNRYREYCGWWAPVSEDVRFPVPGGKHALFEARRTHTLWYGQYGENHLKLADWIARQIGGSVLVDAYLKQFVWS